METATLKVIGMTCQGCVKSVTRVLQEVPGVGNVAVSLEKAEATLDYDPGKSGLADLRKAVENAGFEAA
jgi:copper chaperone